MSSEEILKETPLSERHRKLGAKMVPFAGYTMPIQYSGIVEEHEAVRKKAGLFDVCHMGEVRIVGSGAAHFVNNLVTNDLTRIALGQAMYTCACKEDGGIIDDLIVYKHADDNILIVCNASNRQKFNEHLARLAANRNDIKIRDESDETALLALQGPVAFSVLAHAEPRLENLSTRLRPFHFTVAEIAGRKATIARTGYTGEDGVELFCASRDATLIWEALLDAGKSAGLKPCGLGCRDTLRLEARLSLYGNELSESTHPLEAGLGWTVKLDKADFIGKDALVKAQQSGLARQLVGFEVTGRGSARPGYALLNGNGKEVGECTSGGPSPTLKRPIGLGFLPPEMSEVGTEFLVEYRGKRLPARVVKTPFYRRD
jgi:aminomethyltransferase